MHVKNFIRGALLLAMFWLVGCGAPNSLVPSSTPTRFARNLSTRTPTLLSALPTQTLNSPAPPTDPSLTETPAASEATASPTASAATPTDVPTPAPPLALRDDLPPLTLKDFPRPADDNGLGIHFVPTGYYDAAELDKQIARIQALHLKWALVLYADENQLALAAQKFKDAGIMVVWRKTLRPFQKYFGWGRDIEILNKIGMPPYMQLYNEPEVPTEWEDQPMDQNQFMQNLLQAAKDVYNAGGYPGIQVLDEDRLREFITQVYARQGDALFHRMFFVAHAYGLNHPPDYAQDNNGVLGFSIFAQIFQHRLGFVPPIVIGEGGWKVGDKEDDRYPPIDETLHRDYTLAVYDWFRSGKMSNGKPLPNYVFAFCMWILSGVNEAGAWYDGLGGDRTLTIQAVENLPVFVRKFSW
jgi:hypothetical protein